MQGKSPEQPIGAGVCKISLPTCPRVGVPRLLNPPSSWRACRLYRLAQTCPLLARVSAEGVAVSQGLRIKFGVFQHVQQVVRVEGGFHPFGFGAVLGGFVLS